MSASNSPRGSVSADFRALSAQVRERIDERLGEIWSTELQRLDDHGPAARWPAEAARDLCLRGGKRLRATLVATGYCVGLWSLERSVSSWERVLPIAVAVELLQSYFLIHDDWMDNDDVRRGGPAVHSLLAQRFGSRPLGASGGILAGDYTLALACREIGTWQGAHAHRLHACFARMQLDAVTGQQLDVLSTDADPETVYRLKTGSYSVAGPLELGLLAAGVPDEELRWVEGFAVPLGIAFQLRDDLLGLYGSAEVTGKPRASDLLAGKRSFPILEALRRSTSEQQQEFRAVWGDPEAGDEAVQSALTRIETTGARSATEQRIEHWVRSSRSALDSIQQCEARALLSGVAEALTKRSH